MNMTRSNVDVYIDGKLRYLLAQIDEDTLNHTVKVTVRDVAGPNVFTPVLLLRDAEFVGEDHQILYWTGTLESIAPDYFEDEARITEPYEVKFSAAPRSGGCKPCGR